MHVIGLAAELYQCRLEVTAHMCKHLLQALQCVLIKYALAVLWHKHDVCVQIEHNVATGSEFA